MSLTAFNRRRRELAKLQNQKAEPATAETVELQPTETTDQQPADKLKRRTKAKGGDQNVGG